uniref:Integrase, catalytic region, zinc finger, CCHC-type, peptidase aspartic, catalytic n=1 Tax=Tanacetum cinerariifolium TaxID=118510 RepID=A0A699GPY9_TANCI|nr:hypothetical protein [Tanacetum cinerariifolium]
MKAGGKDRPLMLAPEWQRFVTLVKQSQELKTVSYHKLYDILKQHHNEVNELRAERIPHTANPLALVAQQQPAYHPQNHPTQLLKISQPDHNKLLSETNKINKPTNNNLRTLSNTSRANQDNTPRINRGTGYDNHRVVNVARARENVDSRSYSDFVDNSGPIFDDESLQKRNRNKFLESSNKTLADKLKGEIEDFKTKNKSLNSSNNHFKEANNELLKTNLLMFNDLEKFQAELDRYHDVNYASNVEINCAKAKGDLVSYKMESKKSFNEYTQNINKLNETILEMKKKVFARQETISIMSQEKEAQKKFHKTHEDKELEKVIALENKIKVLDDIVYKTGQSVHSMNMLNRNCKTSFVKPEFLKKAQRANPRLYDIAC